MALKFLNDGYFAGKVGIGIASPAAKLHIDPTTSNEIAIAINGTQDYSAGEFHRIAAGDSNSINRLAIGFGYDNPTDWAIRYSSYGRHEFYTGNDWGNAANTEKMVITSAGNVGIGTGSPTSKLDIRQSTSGGSDVLGTGSITIGSDNPYWTLRGTATSLQDLAFDRNYSGTWYESMRIQRSTGNVGIGTTSPIRKFVVSNSGASGIEIQPNYTTGVNEILSFDRTSGATAYEVMRLNGGSFEFQIGGNEKMRMTSAGNIGIGTTSPNEKLHVVSTTNDNTTVNTVKISHSRSNTDVGTNALFIDMNLSGADATTTDRQNRGIYVDIDSTANGDAANEHRIRGVNGDVRFSGFSDIVQSGYFHAESNNSTVKTAQLVGVYGNAVHDSSTTTGGVSNMYGVYGNSDIQDLGDVDNAFGGFFQVNIGGSRGNANIGITKGVEGQINIDKSTTIDYGTMSAVSAIIDNNEGAVPNFSNQFLFRGDYQGDRGDDAYGIYCEGDKHYLQGNLGVGIANPTQVLHVVGNARVTGAYYDSNNSPGTANQVLVSTATGTDWVDGSGSSIIGGPYLPLSAGSGFPLTGNLFINNGFTLSWGADTTKIAGSSSTNELSLITASTTRMLINSAGNVGIGTTNPSSRLEIKATSATHKLVSINRPSSDTAALYIGNDSASPSNGIISSNYSDLIFGRDQSSTLSEWMRIKRDGNVGIGTTSPLRKLSVFSASIVSSEFKGSNNGHLIDISSSNASPTYNGIRFQHSNTFKMAVTHIADGTTRGYIQIGNGYATGDEILVVDGRTSNVGIGTTSPDTIMEILGANPILTIRDSDTSSSTATSTIRFAESNANDTLGNYWDVGYSPVNLLNFDFNGSTKMTINSSGNVGIGTTSPQEKFVVNAGAITAIASDGAYTAGYFAKLSSDYGPNALKLTSRTGDIIRASDYGSSVSILTGNPTSVKMFINSGGNVGIGNTSPTAKLHVAGTGLFTGLVSGITPVNAANFVTKAYVDGSGGGTGTFLPLAGGTMTGDLRFQDNIKILMGAGDMFQIKHTGTLSQIATYEGDLFIDNNATDKDIIFRSDDGSGGLATYFRLDGGSVTNQFLKTVKLYDNVALWLGDDNDLQIYHDGSNSYINDVGSGSLIIKSSTIIEMKGANNEYLARFIENGSVDLYYNNSLKFETTGSGVLVLGDIQIDSALLSNQENTDVDTGTETVANVAIATYTAAFFDFVIKKTTNVRSGTVYACHDGTNVEFTETSTQDLGDTSDVTLSVDISGGNMRLRATTTSDNWSVKSLIRAI